MKLKKTKKKNIKAQGKNTPQSAIRLTAPLCLAKAKRREPKGQQSLTIKTKLFSYIKIIKNNKNLQIQSSYISGNYSLKNKSKLYSPY